jgi:hypothetical protein
MLRRQGIKENAKTTDNSDAGSRTPDCELLDSPAFLRKFDVYRTPPDVCMSSREIIELILLKRKTNGGDSQRTGIK